MTVDIEKLEALAKAAPAGPWYGPDELSHKGMVFDCDLGSLLSYESIESERDVCIAYVAAANPAALLELIKDLKRNQRMLLSAVCQLGEISAALGADMDSDCDELIGMIEDIRAENASLKTGYEAYERVNTELTQRIANLELCQTASLGVSGIIKSAASELGFDAAGEDSALDYLIGLARSAAALRAECEALRKEKTEPCDGCFMAEAERLRKNAQRYEYLRESAYCAKTITDIRVFCEERVIGPYSSAAECLDRAVDAAMSKEQSHD
ncbi:hypothetical protein QCD74_09370 [Pseudomonas syringae pv. actinidiae]|uniref:hypothetical protein n=1 Tax=Pseudomonas syringae TaxID=317 RepID=UPI002436F23A|nr:hypothetical protein [Pseudomonas syringae]MDG6423744.1 hypothetical protein [Pseudomonas syringae pv. actinidiae]